MRVRSLLVVAALAMAVPAFADKDPFEGWTVQQLKVKVLQLQKENKELKDKAAMAPAPAASTGAAASAPAAATANRLLDDFEADMAKNGQTWWNGCDDGKLGTVLEPVPFAAAKGGSPASPGRSNRIHGKMGANHEPWPWASTALALDTPDLRGYSAISFYVKGDGQKHKVSLCKTAVKDFAHFTAEFPASKDWTKVTLKFSDFAQPSWGAPVAASFEDVEKIQFSPGQPEAPFDFSIDDVTLVK